MLWLVEGWNEYDNVEFIVENLTQPTDDECELVGVLEGLVGQDAQNTWRVSIFQPFKIPSVESFSSSQEVVSDSEFSLAVDDIYRVINEDGKVEFYTVKALKSGHNQELSIWHVINPDGTGKCHNYEEIKQLWKDGKVFVNKKELQVIN